MIDILVCSMTLEQQMHLSNRKHDMPMYWVPETIAILRNNGKYILEQAQMKQNDVKMNTNFCLKSKANNFIKTRSLNGGETGSKDNIQRELSNKKK